MSRFLTASDRSSLIRLASSLPVGSPERKAILAGLHLQSADKGLVACPNCMGSGSVKTYEKGDRALHDLKPCPDCKGKKEVSADRAKAIRRNIDKSASFSPNAMEALSAPADAGTMRGAKKWMGLLRMVILEVSAGSSERSALIQEAKKQMTYAMFLFAQNKGLVAYYKDQKKELDSLQDVALD